MIRPAFTHYSWEARLKAASQGGSGQDAFLVLLSRVVQMANGFALSVVIVRRFGLPEVGAYTVAAALASLLSLVCSAGLQYSLPREALSSEERNTIAAWWSLLLLPLVALSVAPFGIAMSHRPGEWAEIALFATGGYFFAQSNVLTALLIMQHRAAWVLAPAAAATAGTILSAFFGRTAVQFAAILLAARALGPLCVFARNTYARVGLDKVLKCGLAGLRYSPMDLIAMISEQSGPLVMAAFLSRAEVGVFGLCLQCLTTADVPGWSLVQAHYPSLVDASRDTAIRVRSRVLRLSAVIAVLMAGGAIVLGEFVYRVPSFWSMMALLAVSVPSRYLNNFYDQFLRAMGRVGTGTSLAGVKLVLALLLFAGLGSALGLWGCIVALAALAFLSALLYAWKTVPLITVET